MERQLERIEMNRLRKANRELTVKKQKRLLAMIVFLLVLIVALFSIKAFAYANESDDTNKCYKSITIYSGDTLYGIASATMPAEYDNLEDYMNEILFINHMNIEDTLIAGNHLILPYYHSNHGRITIAVN